ncbi:STAS domain-containing protein [Chloroflexia bacterium SDU3-3]|nr:STAS domain-containing protein [Chloroflexia bacterium SDU3-3]
MLAMNDAAIALVLREQEQIRAAAARAAEERQSDLLLRRSEADRLAVLVNELSTPIIPIYSGILVLPLIGAIDSNRAGVVMEALLTKITEHSADAVIIDITGVAIVDTFVAQYLLQTARAASLLGTLVIFTGIGAEIAQTMVQIGVDLDGVLTLSDLEAGIEYALGSLRLAIQPA